MKRELLWLGYMALSIAAPIDALINVTPLLTIVVCEDVTDDSGNWLTRNFRIPVEFAPKTVS